MCCRSAPSGAVLRPFQFACALIDDEFAVIHGSALMASMTILNLDERLKARLRVRAAVHGRSMEDEARDILRSALAVEGASGGLFRSIRARLQSAGGGVDLTVPKREPIREPIDLRR